MPAYLPNRGDLVWLDFTPQAGKEQAGRRPAAVLSPAKYNDKAGLAVVCPITSQIKGYPFEVELPPQGKIRGAILADHLKSIDWRQRRAAKAGVLPGSVLEQVLERIAALLQL